MNKTLNELRDRAHKTAVDHGFTDATPAEDLMLMVSELAEALEMWYEAKHEQRVSSRYEQSFAGRRSLDETESHVTRFSSPPGKPCGVPSELADVIIRVLHFAGKHGIDIEKAVEEKMAYNDSRPFKHGGKTL